MLKPIASICIFRLSAIGDVCHAVASVQAIQKFLPEAKITWVIGKIEHSLVSDLPGIEWIVFDKSEGWRAYWRLRKTQKQTFDVLLHMQTSARANFAAMLIRAKRKIGMPKSLAKEGHSLVVNESVQRPEGNAFHVVDLFCAYAHSLGVPLFTPTWDIPLLKEDLVWAQNYRKGKQPILVIAAAASKPQRSWLANRYAALADYAAQKGFEIILTGGPSAYEKNLASEIQSSCKARVSNLVGKTSLKRLLALINIADVVVAPDTGPAHMAVTQSTPVIGLYAHSNPSRTGPYRYLDYVVEAYHSNLKLEHGIETKDAKWGARVKSDSAMSDISTEAVCEMLDRVIEKENIRFD